MKLANDKLKTDEISFITGTQAIIISDDELKNSVSSLDKSGNAQNNEIKLNLRAREEKITFFLSLFLVTYWFLENNFWQLESHFEKLPGGNF